MTYHWIFDFDGTLVDSKKAIKKCYLKVVSEIAPERINVAQSISIGPTLEETSQEILGKHKLHLLSKFTKAFTKEYDQKTILETLAYPNSTKVLKKLYANGHKISIATNKRTIPTLKLIHHYGWDDFFDCIACIDEDPKINNKSQLVAKMLTKYNQYRNAFFVGDTLNDGISANQNNLLFIKANYGYGHIENWNGIKIFSEINDIQELMDIYI